jgi:phospholipase C
MSSASPRRAAGLAGRGHLGPAALYPMTEWRGTKPLHEVERERREVHEHSRGYGHGHHGRNQRKSAGHCACSAQPATGRRRRADIIREQEEARELAQRDPRSIPLHVQEEMKRNAMKSHAECQATLVEQARAWKKRTPHKMPLHLAEALERHEKERRKRIEYSKAARNPVVAEKVKHVVILMQENRSFDEYFGAFPGVRGFCDPVVPPYPQVIPPGYGQLLDSAGQPESGQPYPAMTFASPGPAPHAFGMQFPESGLPNINFIYPWHMDTTQSLAGIVITDDHEWWCYHVYWNGGVCNGWGEQHSTGGYNPIYCMGYYEGTDLPYHWALAANYTICDAYFASVMGPTMPNRVYLMSGMIDPTGGHGGPVCSNDLGVGLPTPGTMLWNSYPHLLTVAAQNGLTTATWAIYEENISDRGPAGGPGMNAASYFASWLASDVPLPVGLPSHPQEWMGDSAEAAAFGLTQGVTAGSFTGDLGTDGYDVSGAFETHVANRTLPTISWIIPPYSYCEHPPNQD